MKLTKNADPDEYEYIGYGIGLDRRSHFCGQTVTGVKTLFLLVLVSTHLYMLIIKKRMT